MIVVKELCKIVASYSKNSIDDIKTIIKTTVKSITHHICNDATE